MAFFAEGTAVAQIEEREDLVRFRVNLPDGEVVAAGFRSMLGPVAAGDRLVLNTTGIELGLGTGGEAFILWNLDGPGPPPGAPGHIVKLRYTPWQLPVAAVEAQESDHHAALTDQSSLDGAPVVACSLHSQVVAVAAGIKAARPEARVGYLMTDGGALPLAWSNLLAQARQARLVDVTCTAGHAFGGDLEAVTIFSGLLALRHVGRCDAIVAGLGPGVVGTGTRLGFSGIEQGQLLDATTALHGRSVACLRVSFADERERHRGVSHHSLTALAVAAREPTLIAVPSLDDQERAASISHDLQNAGLEERHVVVEADGTPGIDLLRRLGVHPSSMGRGIDQAPELFLAATAAGAVAATRSSLVSRP